MSHFDKLWYQKNINSVAIERARDAIQKTGMALPCKVTAVSGQFVTVSFEVNASPWSLPTITIPKAEGKWHFSPTQVGDYGVTISADVLLAAISGVSTEVADFSQRANLGSTLYWMPIGNKSYTPVDQNAGMSEGPNGWTMQTADGNAVVTVGPSATEIKFGSINVTVNASGVSVSTGATGTFTSADTPSKSITVTNGIITSIV